MRNFACWIATALLLVSAIGTTLTVSATTAEERSDLITLYLDTQGGGWTDNTGWCSGSCPLIGPPLFNTSGTECSWNGIACDSNEHVIGISLGSNNLIGSLPSFTHLVYLQYFYAGNNALTGNSLNTSFLMNLDTVYLDSNQLDGVIPPIANITPLQIYVVSNNALTGSIPSLNGLPNLRTFNAGNNHLTGGLPPLVGLTSLETFVVSRNNLSGWIPCLSTGGTCNSGLTNLNVFDVDHNNLSGPIPSLTGLTNLGEFYVDYNRLTGAVPAVPTSGMLARLCSNLLDLTPSAYDAAWNTATGLTHWWATPFSSNRCDELFNNDFEFSG